MSISLQTNVTSLFAQQALAQNMNFESNTIEQLTSGYRINSSGDDAAGLAVANQYAANISELNQGVLNASTGTSILQIIDGGLSNISSILNRLQTLATESASATFSGNRTTLNQEFQSELSEITRQANNIGLAAGGQYNGVNSVFIGGGNNASNGVVTVDLSGSANQVDANGLGIASASVGARRHRAHGQLAAIGRSWRAIPGWQRLSGLHFQSVLLQRRRADCYGHRKRRRQRLDGVPGAQLPEPATQLLWHQRIR